MSIIATPNINYLEADYLFDPYLQGSSFGNIGLQFQAVIEGASKDSGVEFEGIIDSIPGSGLQFHSNILNFPTPNATQFRSNIEDFANTSALQFEGQPDGRLSSGIQFRVDNSIFHKFNADGGYLNTNYLTEEYLGAFVAASTGLQFLAINNAKEPNALQSKFVINTHMRAGLQFLGVIDALTARGIQFRSISAIGSGIQFNVVVYNTDNLRILADFPSRGLDGNSWTASFTAPGHFNVNNLNTDIVEEIWRSPDFVTFVTLDCDTQVPQGVYVDTIAILNHNITTSASVIVQATNDPTFTLVPYVNTLVMAPSPNFYFISPEYPLAGYRYWRFLIEDSTNPEGYLRIGSILFGSSIIFQGECFVDELDYTLQDFTDTVKTAGFTNVANSRALKKRLGLEFRFLNSQKSNFSKMRYLFVNHRTVLKALWIPTPDPYIQEYTARFALFGKLVTIPRERHKSMGLDSNYVSFEIEVDESL